MPTISVVFHSARTYLQLNLTILIIICITSIHCGYVVAVCWCVGECVWMCLKSVFFFMVVCVPIVCAISYSIVFVDVCRRNCICANACGVHSVYLFFFFSSRLFHFIDSQMIVRLFNYIESIISRLSVQKLSICTYIYLFVIRLQFN